jgi:hypothetical protein
MNQIVGWRCGGLVACLIKVSSSQLTATPRRLPSDLGDNASLASLPFPLPSVSLINQQPDRRECVAASLGQSAKIPGHPFIIAYLTVNHAHNYLGPPAGGRPHSTVWESYAPPGMTIIDHHWPILAIASSLVVLCAFIPQVSR